MVESRLDDRPGRSPPSGITLSGDVTPYQFHEFESSNIPTNLGGGLNKDSPSVANLASQASSPYEPDISSISVFADLLSRASQNSSASPDSMPGDASNRSTPSARNTRSRGNDRRRSFNSGSGNRSSSGLPARSPSPSGFLQPQVSTGEALNTPFQHQRFHYPPHNPVFNQRGGFYGQYTVPTQPSHMDIGQAHHSYPYPRNVYHPAMPDGSPVSPSQQHLYQHQQGLHPHTQAASGSSFSRHQISSNPNVASGTTGASGQGSPTYMGSSHYQTMGFSPPVPSPQYGYPQHFSGTPPVYPSYGPIHYRPQQSSPTAGDGQIAQGSWYFFPSTPSHQSHAYEGTQYRPGYPVQYPSLFHGRETAPFVASVPAPSTTSRESMEPRSGPSSTPVAPTSASPSIADKVSPPSSRPTSSGSRPVVRKEYHPRPPAHRSQWVMWVGNVPSDATEEELWRFFATVGGSLSTPNAGVESIFLISRSNCAFVNFSSASSLDSAIQTFNGMMLRPNDPQCPMLVCRIRRSADDLKSGVGGQRGIGIHKQWVQEQKALKARSQVSDLSDASDDLPSTSSGPDHLVDGIGSMSLSGESRPRKATTTSSSGSFASTTSSFLAEFFPARFFILKSLSEDDLNISVQNGLWATQKHNELLLDQAFRTSKDVFLIFSVNKSGEFYGYGRMCGPIRTGEGNVTWATRSEGSFSPPSPHTSRQRAITEPSMVSPSPGPQPMYFTAQSGHLVDESPLQIENLSPASKGETVPILQPHRSAPPKLGGQPPSQPKPTPSLKHSLDQHQRRQALGNFELDPEAPLRAIRSELAAQDIEGQDPGFKGKHKGLPPVEEAQEPTSNTPGRAAEQPPGWGECFKVEWLERRRIPFHRTRHLRNPWNKGREIKVSRDGTELEPTVGKQLLEEWATLSDPPN